MFPPGTRSPPRSGPPQGPRSSSDRFESVPRQRPSVPPRGPEPLRRDFDRSDVRNPIFALTSADGSQHTASVAQTLQGARSAPTTPAIDIAPPLPSSSLASRIKQPNSRPSEDDPADALVRIQAQRAAAEEQAKQLKEAEDRLIKEAANKREAVERKQVEADMKNKKDELERQRADRQNIVQREPENRPPASMYPPRPPRDRPMPPDSVPRDFARRPNFVSLPFG